MTPSGARSSSWRRRRSVSDVSPAGQEASDRACAAQKKEASDCLFEAENNLAMFANDAVPEFVEDAGKAENAKVLVWWCDEDRNRVVPLMSSIHVGRSGGIALFERDQGLSAAEEAS